MDSSDLLVKDITPNVVDPSLCLRITRLWETPSFKNPLESQTIEMVLIDDEDTRIQATVPTEQIPNFRNQLWEGANILLSDFMVSPNMSLFKYATHQFKITFLPTTTVTEIDSEIGSTYGFKFLPFENLMTNKLEPNQIIDLIGVVVDAGKIFPGEYNNKPNKRRVIRLQDLSGRTVDCTLWDGYVDEFGDYIKKLKCDEHIVLIMQFGKIKLYRGCSSAGTAYYGTRLFINTELPEIKDFKKRFLSNPTNQKTKLKISTISTEPGHIDPAAFFSDCKIVKLSELSSIYTETTCATVATIDSVCREKPWFYIACRKCTYGVTPSDTNNGGIGNVNNKWICKQCGPNVTSVAPRYRIHIRVVEDSTYKTFIIFERDVKKLIKTTAYQMRQNVVDDEDFPDELNEMVGQKLVFVLKVTDFNIGKPNRAYTVSKLNSDEAVIDAFVKQSKNEKRHNEQYNSDSSSDDSLRDGSNILTKDSISKVKETSSDDSTSSCNDRVKRPCINVEADPDDELPFQRYKRRTVRVKTDASTSSCNDRVKRHCINVESDPDDELPIQRLKRRTVRVKKEKV